MAAVFVFGVICPFSPGVKKMNRKCGRGGMLLRDTALRRRYKHAYTRTCDGVHHPVRIIAVEVLHFARQSLVFSLVHDVVLYLIIFLREVFLLRRERELQS